MSSGQSAYHHEAVNQAIVSALASSGVAWAVLSPGSRNSPLLRAFALREEMKCVSSVDERTAGFVGLGLSVQLSAPVALCCTSGSAVLNYGPALAEAFYRHVPLIIISADRPRTRIDRDDGQTIRQSALFDGVCVKASYDIGLKATRYEAVRTIGEAMAEATRYPAGPVHVNVEFDDRLAAYPDSGYEEVSVPEIVAPSLKLPHETVRNLARRLGCARKVLFLAGCCTPDRKVYMALKKLSRHTHIAILAEPASNIDFEGSFINNVDGIASVLLSHEVLSAQLAPDVVVTFGGSTVSGRIKKWLMSLPDTVEHWHIGQTPLASDRFDRLTVRIEAPWQTVLPQLASFVRSDEGSTSGYQARWQHVEQEIHKVSASYIADCGWSDLKAMSLICRTPGMRDRICHLSNGMTVRYADICRFAGRFHRIEANRGVAGIEGSLSTAVGASLATQRPVTLITGDMSASYDLGVLASGLVPADFSMMVLDNEGGDIFRHISATSQAHGLEKYISCAARKEWGKIAEAFDMRFLQARSEEEMSAALKISTNLSGRPSLLVVTTTPEANRVALDGYYDRLQSLKILK